MKRYALYDPKTRKYVQSFLPVSKTRKHAEEYLARMRVYTKKFPIIYTGHWERYVIKTWNIKPE